MPSPKRAGYYYYYYYYFSYVSGNWKFPYQSVFGRLDVQPPSSWGGYQPVLGRAAEASALQPIHTYIYIYMGAALKIYILFVIVLSMFLTTGCLYFSGGLTQVIISLYFFLVLCIRYIDLLPTRLLTRFVNPKYHFSKKYPRYNRKVYGVCAFSSMPSQLWCSYNNAFISEHTCFELHR